MAGFAAGVWGSVMPARACVSIPAGIALRDEAGIPYDVIASPTPFAGGEVSLVQTAESAAGAPAITRQFGCSGMYAYEWQRTFGGYAAFMSKDEKSTFDELNPSAQGISVGCTAQDGPAPNYCEVLVTTLQDRRKPASVAYSFQIDRISGRKDRICLGSGLVPNSTMQMQVENYAVHEQTVADPGAACFDEASSAQIMAELAIGQTLQVQVQRTGESRYHTVTGDTAALADALRLTDFLQSKTATIQ